MTATVHYVPDVLGTLVHAWTTSALHVEGLAPLCAAGVAPHAEVRLHADARARLVVTCPSCARRLTAALDLPTAAGCAPGGAEREAAGGA
jgi:uncharacterized protein YqiB (DUF1249 family)